MILFSLQDVETGMVLGKSIYQSNGTLLLGAGYRINKDIIAILNRRGYTHIYIMEEGTEDVIPEDVISEEVRYQAKMILSEKIDEIKNITKFTTITHEKAIKLLEDGYLEKVTISSDLRKVVNDILKEISAKGAGFMSTLMIKSKDTYFIDHAINTTVLAILIGSKYHFSRAEMSALALGSLLHDIGKIIIEQIQKSDSSESENDLYKEHPTFGYLLVKNSPFINPMEKQIINQHHEFQDGTGFPIGLQGENLPPLKTIKRTMKGQIFRLAEICCVVNVFDNLLMNPFQGKLMTPQEALKQLILCADCHYNRDVVETLLKVVPLFPVGTRVKIVDIVDPNLLGNYGVVARINESKLDRPVIIITANKRRERIKPILLDTSKLNRIELELNI